MTSFNFALILFVLTFSACHKQSETLVARYDEKEMEAAIARARGETDGFLAALAMGDADAFSVKAPITDKNGTEHFWITDVRFEDGVFIGFIGNDPAVVGSVSIGQEWRVKREDISDWMFVRGDRIHGGYAIDPLLSGWNKAKADALRQQLVR